ncbi:MAG: hypothetical protein K0R21_1971 [Anaerocolumna sp.]|jgi:hypothetical protein|nr:hypothetical protein [Anaerocolumna sp.]
MNNQPLNASILYGTLQTSVIQEFGKKPIGNALVQIYSDNDFTTLLYELKTDIHGLTPNVHLSAPPIEYSLYPNNLKPYSEYNLRITAPGFQTVLIYGTQIFPTIGSIQPVEMASDSGQRQPKIIRIEPHVLYQP